MIACVIRRMTTGSASSPLAKLSWPQMPHIIQKKRREVKRVTTLQSEEEIKNHKPNTSSWLCAFKPSAWCAYWFPFQRFRFQFFSFLRLATIICQAPEHLRLPPAVHWDVVPARMQTT